MLSDIDPTCPIIILGDFNMKSIIGKQYGYNDKLEQDMLFKYNLKQVLHQETSNYASVIDMLYQYKSSDNSNLELLVRP